MNMLKIGAHFWRIVAQISKSSYNKTLERQTERHDPANGVKYHFAYPLALSTILTHSGTGNDLARVSVSLMQLDMGAVGV